MCGEGGGGERGGGHPTIPHTRTGQRSLTDPRPRQLDNILQAIIIRDLSLNMGRGLQNWRGLKFKLKKAEERIKF